MPAQLQDIRENSACLFLLFNNFSARRRCKEKQIVINVLSVVCSEIDLDVAEKKISDSIKMIDNLQMRDQKSIMSDPGMYRGHMWM